MKISLIKKIGEIRLRITYPVSIFSRFIGRVVALLLIVICSEVQAQKSEYVNFVDQINSIYTSMTFNHALLGINNIELVNYPSGIAFAYYNPLNNRRMILINYRYLYQKVWKNDKFQSTRIPVLKGLIAHEWAHHYLHHTFQKFDPINERNADILSGRILNENMREDSLNSLTSIVSLYEGKATGRQHLGADARRELIIKGIRTDQIINLDPSKLCETLKEKAEIECMAASKNLEEKIKNCQQIGIYQNKEKVRVQNTIDLDIALSNQYLQLVDSSHLKDKFFIIKNSDTENRTIEYVQVNKFLDSVATINKSKFDAIMNKFNSILKEKLIQDSIRIINDRSICIDLKNKLDSINIDDFRNTDSPSVEAMYNLWYIKNYKTGVKPDECIKKIAQTKTIIDTNSVLKYRLYGDIKLAIDFGSNIKNKQVTYQGGLNQEIQTHNLAASKDSKFLYYFKIKDGEIFYIDNYYHLWSQTIAAYPIQDKIFLQTHDQLNEKHPPLTPAIHVTPN